MWSEHVVFQTPFFNQYFSFFQGIKEFAIEQFIPQFAIKALIVTVFPGTSRFNKKCSDMTCPPKTGPVLKLGFWYNTG
jgi:hypothetical protein